MSSIRGKRRWPIIIGGSHRSGTTLVRRLLNGHTAIFCPAEIHFYKDLLCQFPNDPLAHGRLGRSIDALKLPQQVWLDEFGRAFCRCYDAATVRSGKRRWADKNPDNARNAVHWHRLLGGKMFFLLLVRHPLDILASMEEAGMSKVIPAEIVGRAAHVRDYMAAGLDFAARHPGASSIIRYEDLVSDPRTTMTSFLDKIGENFEDSMLTQLGSKDHDHGLGDQKAIGRTTISPASIGRWKTDLTPAHIEKVTPVLAPVAASLGYDLPA
jgi:hypothetical protein